jgi:hypothetical protein
VASAQQPNLANISNATTLEGTLSAFEGAEPAYIVVGIWNMSLAKPLSQSQLNPIAKTFDSSFTISAGFHDPEPERITISNFKQTSTGNATVNGNATIIIDATRTIQNVPINIKFTQGNALELLVNLPRIFIPLIDGTIDNVH